MPRFIRLQSIGSICRKSVWTLLFALFCTCVSFAVSADETDLHPLYSGPTEQSAVITYLSDGETVTVLDQIHSAWARVISAEGTVGYCTSDLLGNCDAEISAGKDVLVAKTLSPVSVRFSADSEACVVCKLAANVHVALLSETDNGYYEIAVLGTTVGYLPSDAVEVVEGKAATIRSVPQLSPDGVTTEEEAREKLHQLSLYFEDGRYWNYIGTGLPWGETAFCVTDIPCAHSVRGYNYCNVYNGAITEYFPEYGVEMQCLGYASLISDLVFGTEAPISVYYDFDQVRVGDHIRLVYYEHSMIVTDVGTQADGTRYICVTEVNADYENCQITWNRMITEKELYARGDVVKFFTRYTE